VKLAARVQRIAESATARVARRALELARQGVDVVDLGVGEPDFDSPAAAVGAARRALESGFTRYTPTAGTPELRRALAAHHAARHGAPWSAGDAVVTAGAKSALFELALALFESGDEVVLPLPAWVSFGEQIRFAGAHPVGVATDPADGFRIHPEPLLAAVTERTRAIVVCSPCNPTGGVISAAGLAALARGCAERGLLLVSDETYARFVYDGAGHASVAALAGELPETVVLVGSFSKTYAMTGWRLGYLLGPRPVTAAVERVQSHATGNPTSFAMVGALAALAECEVEVAARVAELERRRDLALTGLARIPGFTCRPPAGAFYLFPDVTAALAGGESSLDLAERLLEEARVAVVPGEAFGAPGHLRLSFGAAEARLAEGLRRIAAALA
jgi:aspartate aminotransferase